MGRAKEWSGVGGFLGKQGLCPGMVTDLQVDKKGDRVENVAGAGHQCSSGPSVTLRLLELGGEAEELPGDKPREAWAALGGAWPAGSEGGARNAGGTQGSKEDAQNGAGAGRQGGRVKRLWPP